VALTPPPSSRVDAGPFDLWPELPVAEWEATRDTVHLWTQIVGKVRMALEPPLNHWWHTTLYVSPSGLTTGMMPTAGGGAQFSFDFRRHVLHMVTTSERAEIGLYPRSVSDFFAEFTHRLHELGLDVRLYGRPVEVEHAIPFADDAEHDSYDGQYVERFWHSLLATDHVFRRFRSGFVGKASPVHFFWGAFDLAVTRFSGRGAPPHPGGIPNCPNWVMQEAYSHQLSSCGYWPGGDPEGVFYSYAYPSPDGYADTALRTPGARYDTNLDEFVLPYNVVRTAADPAAVLGAFLQETYEAAADLGHWPRSDLERERPGP